MNKKSLIAIGAGHDAQVWGGHFGMSPQYNLYDRAGSLLEKRPNPYGAGDARSNTTTTPS